MSKVAKKPKIETPILNPKVVVLKRYIEKDEFSDVDDEEDYDEEENTVGTDLYENRADTYTIFKNHNKDLVAKIKELAKTPFDGSVEGDWGVNGKIESEMGDQYICMGEDGKRFFIDKSDLESMKKTWILNLINKTYPVGKYFNENFGYIFGSSIIKVESPEISDDDEFSFDGLGSSSYKEIELDIYPHNGQISFQTDGDWGSNLFMHFNEEGNYVNRDYNLNLVEMCKEKTPTLENALKEIKKLVPAGGYMRKDNIWYGETCAIIISTNTDEHNVFSFSIENHPIRKNNTYGRTGVKAIKKPKDTIESAGFSELLEIIKPALDKIGFQPSN